MMDRNQIWFHGTTAGVIYHLVDPFNASLQSDQSPELTGKKNPKHGGILSTADLPSEHRCQQMSGGQVSEKEIMTLGANQEWEQLANLMW